MLITGYPPDVTANLTAVTGSVTPPASPARPQRSTTVALVPFLFGVTGADELGGVALTRLLGDLGVSAGAARQQLARMRRDGQLSASRRGRGTGYRLAGPFAATFRRLRSGAARTPPPWEGYFHAVMYQVPEARRAYRDRLRRIAQLVGYGLMQQGVLIAARDLSGHLAAVLAEAPPGCQIQQASIGVPAADAARIALSAWDLEDVASSLRGHIATLSASSDASTTPPATAETLRRLEQLLNAPNVDLIRNPNLPTELLPADWPAPQLADLMSQVRGRYLPAARQYATAVIEASASRKADPACPPAGTSIQHRR
jgi:phenylacetic acid degradation operon negative regulatory protein